MITRAILCVLLFLPRQVPLFVLSPDSPITVGKAPTAVATADFNRDGNLDIVVANSGSNNLTVLMGNGKGSFRLASGSPVPAGRKPHHVTAADWNGDGNMDLATAPHDGGSDVTLFLGNGRGGFAREPGSPISSVAVSEPHTHAVIAANANRDDHPDLLVVNAGTNRDKPALSLSVLLNDGKARFRHGPGSPVPLPGILASVATGDFNRDGSLDLAATLEGAQKMAVMLGDGKDGFFASTMDFPGGGHSVASADANADGHADLVVTQGNGVVLLFGNARGEFQGARSTRTKLARECYSIHAADWNRDGRADIAVVTQEAVIVALSDGKGGFAPVPGSPFPVNGNPLFMGSGDFDGNRKSDLVVSQRNQNAVTVLLAR